VLLLSTCRNLALEVRRSAWSDWQSGRPFIGAQARTDSARLRAWPSVRSLAVVPVICAPYSHNLCLVVGLIGLAAHQGWSANLFTLPSDMFPKAAVVSVVGIGGMTGAVDT
jgi:MFS transporter, ACS family, hexuronate transporter